MYKLGLIGYPLDHSFSKKYFDAKFKKEKIKNFSYNLYPIKDITRIQELIFKNRLIGLNVTSPYKTEVIKYLDKVEEIAKKINSVNTIFIHPETNKKYGFNTDYIGFKNTLNLLELSKNTKAIVLGAGSVSKTISYCLEKHQIEHLIVSRNPQNMRIRYSSISKFISDFKLIINTTPLGQYPDTNKYPEIPYHLISQDYYCIDLIYNPQTTIFLKKSKDRGAKVINGKKMLESQADLAWNIWKHLIIKHNV